jgi:hypothetical protein
MTFYAVTDGAAIRRSAGRTFDFASLNDPSNIVLSTGNIEPDFAAAGHFLIGYTINECFQVEGSYTGVTEADNMAAIRDVTPNALGGRGNLFSPFSGFGANPITGVDYNNSAQIRFTSSLNTVELNIRRKVPMPPERLSVSILFGVRYIGLPETFDYATTSNAPATGAVTNTMHVESDNQMIGPQIGSLFELYVDNRWWINFEAKAAVMNDRARQTTDYTNINAVGASVFSGSEREDHTAFAETLDVTFVYRWSPNFTTRLGYQALFLQDVALAANNFNTDYNIVTQGPAQLNHRGSAIFHGPYAGIMFGW